MTSQTELKIRNAAETILKMHVKCNTPADIECATRIIKRLLEEIKGKHR